MAEDAPNHIVTILEVPAQHKHLLGAIRHWENLKIAADKDSVWVKDFTEAQLVSAELKTIPFAHLYVVKENLLFLKGSLLPTKTMPSFLWTPIEKAFQIELPRLNHNFFGLPQKTEIKLVQTEMEQEAIVMLVDINELNFYMQSAPAIRLKDLNWIKTENGEALLTGGPLLPINGKSYWMKNDFIFPVGWALEFNFLEHQVRSILDPDGNDFIFWKDEKQYTLVPKNKFAKLSIASWRASTQL